MPKIKVTVKSKRFPYIRGGVRFTNNQPLEVEVNDGQLKAIEADPNIVAIADEHRQYPLRKWDAEEIANSLVSVFGDFKSDDFKKDGGLRIDAVREALRDENISVELLDKAMPLVLKKTEGKQL